MECPDNTPYLLYCCALPEVLLSPMVEEGVDDAPSYRGGRLPDTIIVPTDRGSDRSETGVEPYGPEGDVGGRSLCPSPVCRPVSRL